MAQATLYRWLSTLAATVTLTTPLAALAATTVPPEWRTVAERTEFRATSTFDETVAFLRRLAAASPAVDIQVFGRSASGRPLPLVVVSASGAFSPAAAAASGQPVVMIQSCIHAGEVDGKDATLLMLRDWVLGVRELPRYVVVLFVPIYNADGHERVSPYNRPNQDGPEAGMGFRATAAGLDLNRDHLRLVTPEARALAALFSQWRPHLHVDNHVTNGVDHEWVLTWAVAEKPYLAPSLDAWVRQHLPEALAATDRAGFPTGPYVDLVDRLHPEQGHAFGPGSPRFSTDYYPLRNRPSILVEMHSYKPYRTRVEANREFLLALLAEVERDPASLVGAVAAAEQATVRAGAADAEPSEAVVRWRRSDQPTSVLWPAYDWYFEDSVVTGEPLLRFRRGVVRQIEVPRFHVPTPELALARPRGYLVLPGWTQIEERLSGHGLRVQRLAAPLELEVEAIRLSGPRFATSSYQGSVGVEDFSIVRAIEHRSIPAGSLWVPADQPDFEVAVQLFEPEAPDSMVRWGLLNTVFERKSYIDPAVLEDLARALLDDPEIRSAWESALADEAFAGDRRARYLWWYRRTPHWDEQIGLLPVLRVMERPAMVLEPWPGEPEGQPEPAATRLGRRSEARSSGMKAAAMGF